MMGVSRGPGIVVAMGMAMAGLVLPGGASADDPPAWDAPAAARYLDARAAERSGYARADRGEGADKVSCLSCHTSLPYALARPSLRRAAGEGRPTAHEERLLSEVR